jgi:hypothetical protein
MRPELAIAAVGLLAASVAASAQEGGARVRYEERWVTHVATEDGRDGRIVALCDWPAKRIEEGEEAAAAARHWSPRALADVCADVADGDVLYRTDPGPGRRKRIVEVRWDGDRCYVRSLPSVKQLPRCDARTGQPLE